MSTQRTRVGKYELGRVLGEGKFSKVKFARNMESGESVAIKIMDKDTLLKQKMAQQIKREISTMNLIKHPNVVQLHEVMASKKRIYIVLEFVSGGELHDKIIHRGRLREDEARKYFQQLITAVDYCHSRGVSHRDLKPENLLLDSYGNLKVSDFGLSALPQQVREDGLLHTACGTPNYVAPEVINDKGYDGATADLWSCGVILFVLMAGYLPFDEQNIMTLYQKICKAEFKYPQWFSSSAKKLISRILNPNPKTRITVSEILKNDWFQKDYMPPKFQEDEDAGWNDIDVFTESEGLVKRQTRFTSKHPAKEILSKIEEAAGPLGFNVKKQNYKVKLRGANIGRKGRLSVAIELFEVAPSLCMVEVQKAGGDTLEFSEVYKKLSSALKDIVWKSKVKCRDKLEQLSNVSVLTYGDLARHTYGKIARYVAETMLIISQCGGCIAYLVFIGQNLSSVFTGSADKYSFFICIFVPVEIALAWVRTLTSLSPFSVFADICNLLAIAIVIKDDLGSFQGLEKADAFTSYKALPFVAGVAVFCFEGFSMTLSLETSMREPQRFGRVLGYAFFFLATLYTGFGLIGYFTYGSETQDKITLNLPNDLSTVAVKYWLYLSLDLASLSL